MKVPPAPPQCCRLPPIAATDGGSAGGTLCHIAARPAHDRSQQVKSHLLACKYENLSRKSSTPAKRLPMVFKCRRALRENRRKNDKEKETDFFLNPANMNSWLWELRQPTNMTEVGMAERELEGDRVQWACAEAEKRLSSTSGQGDLGPGFVERARETAYMWKQLLDQGRTHLELAGFKIALEPDFNLVIYVERERKSHVLFLSALVDAHTDIIQYYLRWLTFILPHYGTNMDVELWNKRTEARGKIGLIEHTWYLFTGLVKLRAS
ncbi:hypothetical protein GGX14DRAFT_406322 [Mycena pura]|uniref:Uncharacterized protein n=1 Tax=Mycena pura TaxID=153505 RepID=A0AAD6Y1P8_9AGAR|nr:hypothetical protein GGX14DRAFT_406322 [Mycena pura]